MLICKFRFNYLGITFVYITIGLALTTIVIEIAADYLKKLHYFGRKLESVAEVERPIPAEWISNGEIPVTNRFFEYLRPLIGALLPYCEPLVLEKFSSEGD